MKKKIRVAEYLLVQLGFCCPIFSLLRVKCKCLCFSHEIQYLFMCIFPSSRVSKLKFRLTEMELGHAERRRVEEVSKLLGNWPRNKTFSLIIQLNMDPKIGLGSNFGSASPFLHKSTQIKLFFSSQHYFLFLILQPPFKSFVKLRVMLEQLFQTKAWQFFHVKQGSKQVSVMYFG